jgi:cytochrome c biogenesis protein CcmG, thiol:disulfide interchange protein DsbE
MSHSTGPKPRSLVLWIIVLFLFACGDEDRPISAAPGFRLPDLTGKMVSLESYRGEVVLLDFWATWCPPCRMSIPELIRLQAHYGEKGFTVLGVSMDDPNQFSDRYLDAFREKNGINYPILRADDHVIRDYFKGESPAIPTMFTIDREGKIRDKIVGFKPDELRTALRRLLE